jgi:hypothetical protein
MEDKQSMELKKTDFDCGTDQTDPKCRLATTLGYVAALSEIAGTETMGAIADLSEFSDILTVRWHRDPTAAEKEFFNKAWKSQVSFGGGLCHTQSVRAIIRGAFAEGFAMETAE